MTAGAAPASAAKGRASFELAAASDGQLAARGELTFATARLARAQGLQALRKARGAVTIDCAAISQADSAGLAVLIDWLAQARRRGGTLHYRQLSLRLLELARISAVDGLLLQGVGGAGPSVA